MKRILMTIGALVALGSSVSFLVTTEAAPPQVTFWTEIAQGNMTELAAANLALEKASSDAVKQFAQQMVTDHTAAGSEFETLATSKKVTLPSAVSAAQKADLDKLGAKTGADFDHAFMKMMISDHEKMAKILDHEAKRNADADVKAFAAKTLPVVQGHLSSAKTINDSMKPATTAAMNKPAANHSANSNKTKSNKTVNTKSNSNQ